MGVGKAKKQYQEETKNLENYLKAMRSLVKLRNQKELTKDLMETLIEKIYVYPGKRVEVVFTYSDVLTKGVERHERQA